MIQPEHLKLVEQAIDFIENHLNQNISVGDVCSQVPLSPWQFQRLFRAYVGNSIGEYLSSRRLSTAAEVLIESRPKRVLDVALEYQFGSQEAFTRAFKRLFGVTPGRAPAHRSEIRLLQKKRLSTSQLRHNLEGIWRSPEIHELPERRFVGVKRLISSPFSGDESYVEQVSQLWREFNGRRSEIGNRIRGVGYGLVQSPSGQMTEDRFPYVASVEVAGDATVPSGMEEASLPAGTYAFFERRGLADKSRMSMDFIYGYWLPYSGFERAQGLDFEMFDHRMRLDDPESMSVYCIPVTRK